MDQFDLAFNPIPPLDLSRIFSEDWASREMTAIPADNTIYGHNVELVWLLNRAGEILERPSDYYTEITRQLIDHAIKFGLDKEIGGLYQYGPHNGPASVKDKEWWPNCEVLVGFLDAYEKLGNEKYFDAFNKTWDFDKKYFINQEIGEWRQLLDERGNIISGDIGNHRKAIYHTARAMLECMQRLEKISG